MLVMDGVLICFWSQLSISGDRGILHEENSWSFMFRKFRCFHCYIQCLYQWVKHLPASGSHCYLRVHRIDFSFQSSSALGLALFRKGNVELPSNLITILMQDLPACLEIMKRVFAHFERSN
ncbi:uncharacterized protein LOC132037947 isoform X7 [Lycium ferocissimum]|uniref:uncharacterized protein LOC132037947 isoform X7 n=1 Tax=Lycium ferocissimum TaxID=112874 RepID=UPI0028156C4D|nr:uncharacterized protein LOC132037947 isoform X7 [Lycium ferocissimum]